MLQRGHNTLLLIFNLQTSLIAIAATDINIKQVFR
jgi:hypothetical protein